MTTYFFICVTIVYCHHTYFEYILSLSVNQGLLNEFLKLQDMSQEKCQNRSLLLITCNLGLWCVDYQRPVRQTRPLELVECNKVPFCSHKHHY